jgi:hypothetical protein
VDDDEMRCWCTWAEKRWEDEITKDLQEFEMVGGSGSEVCDEDLEKDLAALWIIFITTIIVVTHRNLLIFLINTNHFILGNQTLIRCSRNERDCICSDVNRKILSPGSSYGIASHPLLLCSVITSDLDTHADNSHVSVCEQSSRLWQQNQLSSFSFPPFEPTKSVHSKKDGKGHRKKNKMELHAINCYDDEDDDVSVWEDVSASRGFTCQVGGNFAMCM